MALLKFLIFEEEALRFHFVLGSTCCIRREKETERGYEDAEREGAGRDREWNQDPLGRSHYPPSHLPPPPRLVKIFATQYTSWVRTLVKDFNIFV